MAIVRDAALPSNQHEVCAMDAFTQPTPRIMERQFSFYQSKIETHIPNLSVAVEPVDNSTDLNAPVIAFTGFWLSPVSKTVRFS